MKLGFFHTFQNLRSSKAILKHLCILLEHPSSKSTVGEDFFTIMTLSAWMFPSYQTLNSCFEEYVNARWCQTFGVTRENDSYLSRWVPFFKVAKSCKSPFAILLIKAWRQVDWNTWDEPPNVASTLNHRENVTPFGQRVTFPKQSFEWVPKEMTLSSW